MAKIKILASWTTNLKAEYASLLIGLTVSAEAVNSYGPKPNTKGRAYEVSTDEAAKALANAGHKTAAAYFEGLNQYPAMQRLGFLIPTADAEAC